MIGICCCCIYHIVRSTFIKLLKLVFWRSGWDGRDSGLTLSWSQLCLKIIPLISPFSLVKVGQTYGDHVDQAGASSPNCFCHYLELFYLSETNIYFFVFKLLYILIFWCAIIFITISWYHPLCLVHMSVTFFFALL